MRPAAMPAFSINGEVKLRLGLPGFGEAGVRFANDLSHAGLTDIVALGRE
jgi:hypothetical protein